MAEFFGRPPSTPPADTTADGPFRAVLAKSEFSQKGWVPTAAQPALKGLFGFFGPEVWAVITVGFCNWILYTAITMIIFLHRFVLNPQ